MLLWWIIAFMVTVSGAQENETTTIAITTEVQTSPLPEFVPFVNPQDLYVAIREHLGDNPDAHLLAIRMVDASAKIPNGVLGNNYEDLGNFDECYNLHEGGIYGKYCQGIKMADAVFEQQAEDLKADLSNLTKEYDHFLKRLKLHLGLSMVPFRVAVCIPHTMNTFIIPSDFIFLNDMCYTQLDEHLDGTAIATIAIIGAFFLISLISTFYEICIYLFELEPGHWSLTAFSYILNGKKLMSVSMTSQHELSCLRGIRVLSMLWIMWSHYYMLSVAGNIQDKSQLSHAEDHWYNMAIFNGQLAVDSFLLIGGVLVVYNFLMIRPSGAGHLVFFYVHRYMRVTPMYAVLIFLHRNVLPYVGNGPSWQLVKSVQDQCTYGWWSNLLYLANYIHKDVCLGHTYYLHIDMQLYCLSPLVLYPMLKYPKIIVSALGMVVAASIAVAYLSAVPIRAGPFYLNLDYFRYFIITTHTRFGSYIIGMILGYFIYRSRTRKLVLSKNLVLFLWAVCIAVMFACVFGSYNMLIQDVYDVKTHALYISINRPVFATAVSIAVFLCITGHGGFINTFLSHALFIFLSKLTFPFYLIHMSINTAYFIIMRTQTTDSFMYLVHGFWGVFAWIMMASIPLTLTFEAPALVFEKMLRKKFAQKRSVEGAEGNAGKRDSVPDPGNHDESGESGKDV